MNNLRSSVSVRVIGGLLLLIALGTGLLMLPVMAVSTPLTLAEALFTAASALTVTGLSEFDPGLRLTRAGQVVLMLLVQMGGVGYMVLAVLVFQILGRQLSIADRIALQDSLGVLNTRGIAALARQVLVVVLSLEALGAGVLYLNWSHTQPPGPELAFRAVFLAICSFCNAGFALGSTDPRYVSGFPSDTLTLATMGVLIVLGGLGIPVLYELVAWVRRRRFSLHTRLTLAAVGVLVVWGAFALWVSESDGLLASLSLDRQIELALFQSVSSRTAGYSAFADFTQLGEASQLLLITLMFIGCAPASMGGGVTTGTLVTLVLALRAYLQGRSTPIVGGKAIPGEMVRKAASVLTISLFLVLTASWLLLLTHDVSFPVAVFEVVSALSTSGLSLGMTSQLNGFGRAIIILCMFWGRLGALTVLVLLTRRTSQSRVTYPEEKLLIG